MLKKYFCTSIGRKQTVAITGLMLIVFVIGHLLGNLFIFVGPDAFNAYADKIKSLYPAFYVAEFGLLAVFLTHIVMTARLVTENIKARKSRYGVSPSVPVLNRLMPITGVILILFLGIHLIDYRLAEHHGLNAIFNGQDLGLYGVVINSFLNNGLRTLLYVIAMLAIGAHLSHAIQSVFQTFGYNNSEATPTIKKISLALGTIIGLGFASIPLFVVLTVG